MEAKLLTKSVLSAAEQGHKTDLRDYISRCVVGVVDEEGSTPLMYAAANGREEVVRLLLDDKVLSYVSYKTIIWAPLCMHIHTV